MAEASPSVTSRSLKKETISLKDQVPQDSSKPKLFKPIPDMMRVGWLSESSYTFVDLSAQIPSRIKFSDVLKPTFWGNVMHMFQKDSMSSEDRTGAIIRVRTDDHSYYAILYVRAVLNNGLIVQCVGPAFNKKGQPCPINLQTGEAWVDEDGEVSKGEILSSDFILEWNTTKGGFDILRKSDGIVIGDGKDFKTRESAMEFIDKVSTKR